MGVVEWLVEKLGLWMGESLSMAMLLIMCPTNRSFEKTSEIAFLRVYHRVCFVTSFHGLQERSFSEKSEMALCEFREFFKRYEMIPHMNNLQKGSYWQEADRGFPQKKKPERLRCEPFIDKGTSFKNPCESLACLIGFHVMIMFQLAPVAP